VDGVVPSACSASLGCIIEQPLSLSSKNTRYVVGVVGRSADHDVDPATRRGARLAARDVDA